MSGIASDIISRQESLQTNRAAWDEAWQDVSAICFPMSVQFSAYGTVATNVDRNTPRSVVRTKDIYDSTAMYAVQRFGSALESMVTPRSSKWHAMAFADGDLEDGDVRARRWLEGVRDRLFRERYASRSGFAPVIQQCYRGVGAFGNAVMFVENGFDSGSHRPILYRAVHLAEVWLDQDAYGNVDSAFRRFTLTARQAADLFQRATPATVKAAAEDPVDQDRIFTFIHGVMPRDGARRIGVVPSVRNAPLASLLVFVDEQELVAESGYATMPYIDFRLDREPGEIYAESPALLALPEIKGLNAMARDTLLAAQQRVRPALAAGARPANGSPINLNPGKVNYNMIDPGTGRLMVQPIVTGVDPATGLALIQDRRSTINSGFYVNLFQILTDNPQMTATEALLRNQEKGELLGPLGARIQDSLCRMVEREVSILESEGLFDPRGPLVPPRHIQGREWTVEFASPLDRMRRSEEGVGTLRTLETMQGLAQTHPEVLDNLNLDEISHGLAEINGMPARFLLPDKTVKAKRGQRARAQEAEASLANAERVAGMIKNMAPAQQALESNIDALAQ